MPKRTKPTRTWVYSPPKPAKPPVPDALKAEVTTRANELVETVLKPQHIQPPPENMQFNYLADIFTKWYRGYFYFCATYNAPGPNALAPSFETQFARMEYAGNNRFHLAWKRHTGQWIGEMHRDLSLDECLETIKDDEFFAP